VATAVTVAIDRMIDRRGRRALCVTSPPVGDPAPSYFSIGGGR
jgi:hypothetical protein